MNGGARRSKSSAGYTGRAHAYVHPSEITVGSSFGVGEGGWLHDLLGNSPLALAVEVNAIDLSMDLIKTNIIEALKARPGDGAHAMVGDEEVLFPAHENVLALGDVLDDDRRASAGLFRVGAEGRELGPMRQVGLVVGAPVVVLGHEAVLVPDDFALEVGGQGWVVVGQA